MFSVYIISYIRYLFFMVDTTYNYQHENFYERTQLVPTSTRGRSHPRRTTYEHARFLKTHRKNGGNTETNTENSRYGLPPPPLWRTSDKVVGSKSATENSKNIFWPNLINSRVTYNKPVSWPQQNIKFSKPSHFMHELWWSKITHIFEIWVQICLVCLFNKQLNFKLQLE